MTCAPLRAAIQARTEPTLLPLGVLAGALVRRPEATGLEQGRCREVHSPADRTVDLFPENVSMTGVPAGLFDHVHQDPSQRHGLGR